VVFRLCIVFNQTLLLADGLVVPSFTSNGLQKKIDSVESCGRWRYNLNKSKKIAIKKGWELKTAT